MRPFSTAFLANNPAASITLGLDVFVQLVMAAIRTEPVPILAFFLEVVSILTDLAESCRVLPNPFSVTGRCKALKNSRFRFGSSIRSCGRLGPATHSESPLVIGEQLLCTPGGAAGSVIALNKKTGALLWRSTELTDAAAYSSLIIAKIAGTPQVIVFTGAHVAGLAPATGKVLWSVPRDGRTAVAPTPVCKDDCVFVTSGYGAGCNLFKITRTGEVFKADAVYANKEMVNHHGGVVMVGTNVYGFSDGKGWVCLDFKTGQGIWESKKLGKGTLLAAADHLYLRSETGGMLVLLTATPSGWQETGRFSQPNLSGKNTWAHLVISGGKLFVRDQDVLICYNIKK